MYNLQRHCVQPPTSSYNFLTVAIVIMVATVMMVMLVLVVVVIMVVMVDRTGRDKLTFEIDFSSVCHFFGTPFIYNAD